MGRGEWSAAALACGAVSLGAGAVDAGWALTHAEEVSLGAGAALWLCVEVAGLYVLLVAPLCLGLAVVSSAAPWDVGPVGLWRGLRALGGARGQEAARRAGWIWALGLGGGAALGGMMKLNHLFVTTFHHPTLIAVALAAATLAWLALAAVSIALGARALARVMGRMGAASNPLLPLALGALVVVGALGAIPLVFEETWGALDLRAPVMALGLVVAAWAACGLLWGRELGRAVVAGAVALCAALPFVTLWTFGASAQDAPAVYAVRERGLLAGVPLGILQRRLDGDKDGFSARLGGGDCDDQDPRRSPGAEEILGNGIDEDCDGEDLRLEQAPSPGEPVVKAGDPNNPDNPDKAPAEDPAAPPLPRKKYNILWVLIDTVRGDATGYMGYERPTTPNLDKLAARALVFERASSISSKTPTVMGPLLAGRYPSELERSFHHFVYYDKRNVFMAEILKEQGYLTAATGAHWYFKRKYGYDQGFSRWKGYMIEGDEMERIPTSAQVTDNAVAFLDALAAGGLPADGEAPAQPPASGDAPPWFLFVHYLDPHKHYIDHDGFAPFGTGPRARYDGEIRFVDHHLGRLLERMEAHDPGLKNTLVVVTSDHGEAFGEHDQLFHGRDLFEHQLHVPLVVSLPGAAPKRIKERVSLIDLPRTLLDAVGVEAPAEYDGVSRFPALVRGEPLKEEPIYAEMPPGPYNGEFRSLTVGKWKLIHRLHGNFFRLFDLEADPGELKDLMTSQPEVAQDMKRRYQLFRAQHVQAIDANKKISE